MRLKLADDVERPTRNVVVFFADGMDVQRLHELLDAGLLPNIRRTFVEGGVEVRDAISSMPSITYPNCSAIVTGLYPGHHGILGNFWFDRDRAAIHYYMTLDTARDVNGDLRVPTIYDMLSDRLTMSVLAQTHRGVTVSYDLKSVFDWGWMTGGYQWVDKRVGETFLDVVDTANRLKRWPTVLMTYYPGVDEIGHRQGPDSAEFASAVTDVDNTVGRVTRSISALGLDKSTYYVLLADHGMAPRQPAQDFAFIEWLRHAKGLKVLTSPLDQSDYADRLETLQKYDAVATVDAGRVAMIHLRGTNWTRRPGFEGVRAWAMSEPAIHDLPAVEMVASRGGPERAMVWSHAGSFMVERRTEGPRQPADAKNRQQSASVQEASRKYYRVLEYEGDPLALKSAPTLREFVQAGWHESREWLAASATSRYPDLVPQVVEMFDSPHTGDVVVFAAEDWLLYPKEWAGHGSTLHRDMHVPMFFAGPGLPAHAEVPVARLVDLVPTLVGLVGEGERLQRFSVDGIDLSQQLHAATPVEVRLPPPTPPRKQPAQ